MARQGFTASAWRFFKTPKGLLTIVLAILILWAAWDDGIRLIGPDLGVAVLVAAAIDVVILRIRNGGWEFPSGAVLSGMLIAMVLSEQSPWYAAASTSAIAIVSKYIFRTKSANVFNPAALGIVVTFYIFQTGQSWWGALPDSHPVALGLLFAVGVFMSDRVNKMPLVLTFLGTYYLLFTGMSFLGDPRWVAEIFRSPDLQMALFFAFFILTDPPTSPVRYPDQIICGVIVAAVSFAVFEWMGVVYYLLAGVLVGNVWEAWRRVKARNDRVAKHNRHHHALAISQTS